MMSCSTMELISRYVLEVFKAYEMSLKNKSDRDKYQLFITKFKSTLFYKIINLKYGGVK